MMKSMRACKLLTMASTAVVLNLFLASSSAYAEDDTIGSDEYRNSCLACHGVGGHGNGPLAKFLTVKPTDLTSLAKNNGGQYPFLRVYQFIDGRAADSVHGGRAMPIWGDRYLTQEQGRISSYGGDYEKLVQGRILELVYYIQSIQE